MPDKLDLELQIKIAEASLAKAKAQIASLQSNNKTLGKLQVGVDSSGIRAARSSLGQIRNDADQFTKSMAAANARVLAFGTAVGVIEGMRRSFLALIKTTVGVEESLTKISVVAGDDLTKAGVSISQLGKSLFDIARDTGQSFETVNQAALEFQRQGIGVQESLKRTRDAMIAVRISGVSVGDAVSGLTSILNAFKKSGLDSTTVLNKLVALDNSSAASFPDLIQGMQRSASVSQLAGNNFDQTAASIATLQEIVARGGPVIGNALKSIDTRLYGEKSLEFLEKFQGGIVKTKDSAGQLLPSIEIIRNLSQALKTVPKGEQLGVLTKLSGLYQVNSLAALVDSFQLVEGEISLYDKNLRTSLNTTNEAGVANEKLSEILASQFNTINVNIGEFLNKLGEIGVKNPLSGVLDFLIKIQGTLQGILEGSGPLDTIIQKVAKFAGGALFSTPVVAGGAFVLVKIIKDFLSFAGTAFKTFTGINQKLGEEGSLASTINSKLQANTGELNSAFSAEQRRLSVIKSSNAEYSKQLALTTGIASATSRPSTSLLSRDVIEGAANVRKSGGIVGDVSDYLPSIIGGNKPNPSSVLGSSINNGKATVSSASAAPSGLALGKPNISSGLRNKSGQFIDSKGVSNALGLLINSWVFAGKESLEMGNLIRKAVGDFDLGPAFKIVSKEANAFAQQLIKERNASNIRAKTAIPSSLGKLNTGGTGLTSSAQFAGLGFNRPATEVSKVGLGGFPNISNLPQFDKERLALRSATEQRLRIDTNNRIAEQQKLAQKTRARDYIRDTFNRVETRRGEAQKRLNELKSGQSNTVNYGLQGVIPRKDAIQRQRREVAFQAALAKQVKAKLQAQDKELYEQYGVSAGSSSKTVISESQKANQLALKERLQNKFGNRAASGQPLLDGGNTLAGLRRSDDISGAKKTGIDGEALRNFAFKAVLVTSLFQGLSESLRGVSPGLDKFADFLSTASLAGGGIKTLSEVGGIDLGSLVEKASGFDPKSLTGFKGKLATAFAPLLAFGAGFVKFLPIIGQAGLVFTIFNSAVKQLTGSSIIDKLSLALGGLTDDAKKAGDRFNEIAKDLFDPKGGYLGRSLQERQSSLSSTRQDALRKITAQRQGIKIDGKTAQEIAAASFEKLISDSIANIETGGIINDLSLGNTEGPRSAVISDLSNSAKKILNQTLAEVTSGTLDELKSNAIALGITKIGDTNTVSATREQIQAAVAKAFTEQLIKAYSSKDKGFGKNTNFNNFIQDKLGAARLSGLALNFLEKGKLAPGETPNFAGSAKEVTPESRKKFFDFQKDLLESIYNGASAQIEAEIKNLDAQFNNPSLTQSARRQLEKQKDILAQEALDVGNLFANAEFKNNKQIIQSQLGVNDKTQEDIDRELFIRERNLKNTNEQYKNSTILLKEEISAREKASESLDKFTKSFNKIDSNILLLGTRGAKNAQSISKLNFQATNPSNTTLQQEAASRAINNSNIDDLKDKRRVAGLELDKALLDPNISLEDAREAREGYKQLSIGIDTQIAELENATKGIGAIANTSIELANSLTDFERSIPSSRAQNDFNTLQSTDASGIAGGLISKQVFGAAEGKSGEELVSFLADQNFLLNEQFKIRTASSAAEKLELETQLELSRELLDIKTQSLDPAEKQRQIEEAINKNLEKRRSFGFGVSQAQSNIQSEIQTFGSDFGKTATEGFRDGLVSAMQVAVSQTDNLKDSLLDVALAFANKLRDAALTNLANLVTNSFTGGGSGGGIVSSLVGAVGGYFTGGAKKYASGGTVTGGSGVKDDVPTLLMGGEYVIPKSTVKEYGKGFFDSLRNGSVGKMAQGGYFAPGIRGQGTISGKENLLDFATQTATSGKGDYISQLSGNAAIASLEPESLRLSNFNRFGDSPIVQATQDTKEQAFGLYLDQLNVEKEYQAQLLQAEERAAALKKAEKDKKKQFLISLALAAVGAGVSYGASGVKTGSAAGKTSSSSASSISNQRYYDVATGILKTSASTASSSYGGSGGGYSVPYANAPAFSGSNKQISYSNIGSDVAGIYSGFSNNRIVNRSPYAPAGGYGYDNPLLPRIYANGQYRNSGGYVGGNGDNVPAMLSNKEYVLNSSAAKKLGDKNLYALNSGQPQSGGDSSDKIISKLDELIQKTVGASNITVSVTMDSSGKEQSSQSSDEGSQQGDTQRNLSRKIKETVVNVIREEQRPGGILARR